MKYDDDMEHIYLDDEDQAPVDTSSLHTEAAAETSVEYRHLGYVLLAILTVSVGLSLIRGISVNRLMADFMAVFFITFAAFKFANLEGFVRGYRSYDVLAGRIRPWAYAIPYAGAFAGFWYLLSDGPNNLNVLVMFIAGTASIGAYREVQRKSRFRFACLDRLIRLPLARVSLIENTTMFVMACLMLFV